MDEREAGMHSRQLAQAALPAVEGTESVRNLMAGAETNKPAHSAAVVLHFLSHYREAVYRRLTDIEESEQRYVLYADTKSNIPSLKVIDFESRAAHTPTPGRITWRRIANVWFGQHVCWQRGVLRLAWSTEHDTLIFMGSMYFLSTWATCLLARLRRKRVLMWGHGFRYHERGAKGLLRGIFYRLAHGHLLYGHHARDIMLAKGFPPSALYVIYNTLDIEHLSGMLDDFLKKQGRTADGSGAGLLRIVMIGRLTVEKQVTLLIDALAMLRDSGFNAELTLIGDGPDREAISARAQLLGVGKQIRWLGALYDETLICPHVAAADLCVVPGKLGLTAVHAMAYGTPVITHDDFKSHSPEFEVIVPGQTGMFFRKGDASDLANAIRSWHSQSHDRAILRQRCRHIVGTYYTPQMQQSIIDKAVASVPATLIPEASTRPQLGC